MYKTRLSFFQGFVDSVDITWKRTPKIIMNGPEFFIMSFQVDTNFWLRVIYMYKLFDCILKRSEVLPSPTNL